jgi:hypothetical protein
MCGREHGRWTDREHLEQTSVVERRRLRARRCELTAVPLRQVSSYDSIRNPRAIR